MVSEQSLSTFQKLMHTFNREQVVQYATHLLLQNSVTIPQLYEEIITPCLEQIQVKDNQQHTLVWQEHALTNIARMVVENAFPLVMQYKKEHPAPQNQGKQVVVLCPEEEYHDLGARMGTDYFTMLGYDAVFVGANTPKENILSVCAELSPYILLISVSNFFNLVPLRNIVQSVKENHPAVRVVLAGSAFSRTGKSADDFGADTMVNNFNDIQSLEGEQA